MHVRTPDIRPDQGLLVWSRVPEFALAYNSYSVVIPHVEYYLNGVMNQVRKTLGPEHAQLEHELGLFIRQEAQHARFHKLFNQRMYEAGHAGLQPLVEELVADLGKLRATRSLAFNVAYCAGFECIATFDSRYIHERCDDFFEDADPHGANLLLWHVAEEFEHRAVCHHAFQAVSGSYATRIHGLIYAFWHVGGAFLRAERLVLEQFGRDLTESERAVSVRRSKRLFWRQLTYVAPRMLRILLPWNDPAKLPVPARISAALDFFRSSGPIVNRFEPAPAGPG